MSNCPHVPGHGVCMTLGTDRREKQHRYRDNQYRGSSFGGVIWNISFALALAFAIGTMLSAAHMVGIDQGECFCPMTLLPTQASLVVLCIDN